MSYGPWFVEIFFNSLQYYWDHIKFKGQDFSLWAALKKYGKTKETKLLSMYKHDKIIEISVASPWRNLPSREIVSAIDRYINR